MRRLWIVPMALLLAACPKDKEPAADTAVPVDTMASTDTAVDLSTLETNLPPVAPDTFTRRNPADNPDARRATQPSAGNIPAAPAALMSAVEREQAFSKFCYQEFGQKSDPQLRGGVAMVVTVGSGGITNASVANSNWTSNAGSAVNRCLNEKAKQAWKLEPGEVKAGRYVVQLQFSGG
jgi:hypothetical protein